MVTYSLYIDDARYTVPTLVLVTLGDEAGLRDLARKKLNESKLHLAVTGWADNAFLFSFGREEPATETPRTNPRMSHASATVSSADDR